MNLIAVIYGAVIAFNIAWPRKDVYGAKWYFQYGTSPAYGHSTTHTPLTTDTVESVSVNITGLLPGTTYHYRFVAENSAGGPSLGRDRTFTTRPLTPASNSTACANDPVSPAASACSPAASASTRSGNY